MNVVIICFGAMRDYLPPDSITNRVKIELPEGATVADAIDAFGAPRALVFAVLVDGIQASIDDRVPDDAEITLMPPFAGGGEGYP